MRKRSFRAEREFGFIVGGVFTLLSVWWLYRGKLVGAAHILLPVGGVLLLLGLILPRLLVFPNKVWMTMAEGMSFVSTRIILAFVYFAVLTPIGLIKRALGWDPLNRRAGSKASYWRPYSPRQKNPRHFEKMF
jgi:Saxitoxin biosynthesis operon protein SxtJ